MVDVNRRLFIGGGGAVGVAAVTVAAVEGGVRLLDLDGGDRRFTGSHEIGSFDPDAMPRVSWINDSAPSTPIADWELRLDDELVDLAELTKRCRPVVAALDCTGGWWSAQNWDVVSIADVIPTEAPSFKVVSATGYSRVFPMRDADAVYLGVGYGGRPLRRGHGAPVRIVAPGRRGPWWVKWVVSVEPTDQPSWLQLPFPLT